MLSLVPIVKKINRSLFLNQLKTQGIKIMKLKLSLLSPLFVLLLSLNPVSLHAATDSHNFGLGILLGDPSSITGKYWFNRQEAADAGIAFSFNNSVLLYGDYLFHYPGAFKQNNKFLSELTPYVGIGGLIAVTSSDRDSADRFYGRTSGSLGLAVRIPLGIEWQLPKPSIGVFIEFVPGLSVVPSTSGLVEGGLGIRYYF